MSSKISFIGAVYTHEFSDVKSGDIILSGKHLSIQGVQIPVGENCLYKAMAMFAYYSAYPKATIKVMIESDGKLQYVARHFDGSIVKAINKVLSFGTFSDKWEYIFPGKHAPKDDEYLRGDDPDVINYNFRYPW